MEVDRVPGASDLHSDPAVDTETMPLGFDLASPSKELMATLQALLEYTIETTVEPTLSMVTDAYRETTDLQQLVEAQTSTSREGLLREQTAIRSFLTCVSADVAELKLVCEKTKSNRTRGTRRPSLCPSLSGSRRPSIADARRTSRGFENQSDTTKSNVNNAPTTFVGQLHPPTPGSPRNSPRLCPPTPTSNSPRPESRQNSHEPSGSDIEGTFEPKRRKSILKSSESFVKRASSFHQHPFAHIKSSPSGDLDATELPARTSDQSASANVRSERRKSSLTLAFHTQVEPASFGSADSMASEAPVQNRKSMVVSKLASMRKSFQRNSLQNVSHESDAEEQVVVGSRLSTITGKRHGSSSKILGTVFRSRYVISPDTKCRVLWDMLAATVLFWQLISIPVDLSFNIDWKGRRELDMACDLIWIFDMLLQFFTGYYDQGVLVLHRKMIVVNYLRTWFILDILALLPSVVHWIAQATSNNEDTSLRTFSLLRALKITKLLKLVRVFRVMDAIVKLEVQLDSRIFSSLLRIFLLILTPILVSHFVACIFWAVGSSNGQAGRESWIDHAVNEESDPSDPAAQYIAALYFAITITSTVGFGDIFAMNTSERLWVMFVMSFVSALVGVVVSGISTIWRKASEHKVAKKELIAKAVVFLAHHNCDDLNVQLKVTRYLEKAIDAKERMQVHATIMDSIKSSGSLYAAVNVATIGRCLTQHKILSKLPMSTISRLADECEMLFRAPGEVLQFPNKPNIQLTYICAGTVKLSAAVPSSDPWLMQGTLRSLEAFQRSVAVNAVIGEKDVEASDVLTAGDFLGPLCIFGDFGIPDRLAVTSTFCELTVLKTSDFQNFVKYSLNPKMRKVLQAYAAFTVDNDKVLRQLLDDGFEIEAGSLLKHESALHEAARRGASKCIKLLLEQNADPNEVDTYGRRPLLYAAKAQHKEVVQILALHGAQAKREFRRSVAKGSKHRKSETRRSVCVQEQLFTRNSAEQCVPESLEEFVERLPDKLKDADNSNGGRNGTKSLADLYQEVQRRDSLVEIDDRNQVLRYLNVVRLLLFAKTDFGECSLMMMTVDDENDDEQMAQTPSKWMRDEEAQAAAQQLMAVDLGLPHSWQEQNLRFAQEICVTEEEEASAEYPDLVTIYVNHDVTARVINPASCGNIGLPEGKAFSKTEFEGDPENERRHVFMWVEEDLEEEPQSSENSLSEVEEEVDSDEMNSQPEQAEEPELLS